MNAPMPCSNTALLSQHEHDQLVLDREPRELPDFATDEEAVRDAGIPKEHRQAVMDVIGQFQMGSKGSHTELLIACAKLERSLFAVWRDEA